MYFAKQPSRMVSDQPWTKTMETTNPEFHPHFPLPPALNHYPERASSMYHNSCHSNDDLATSFSSNRNIDTLLVNTQNVQNQSETVKISRKQNIPENAVEVILKRHMLLREMVLSLVKKQKSLIMDVAQLQKDRKQQFDSIQKDLKELSQLVKTIADAIGVPRAQESEDMYQPFLLVSNESLYNDKQ